MRTQEDHTDFASAINSQKKTVTTPAADTETHSAQNKQIELASADSQSVSTGRKVVSFGILKYESGDIYEGQLLNGRRSGKGKMAFTNGDKYTGMWHHDQMSDPSGVYQFANGNEYVGSHKPCSKMLGRKFGQFDGAGTLKIKGKGEFVGNFKNHTIHGNGKFKSLDGQITIEKIWNNMELQAFTNLIDNLVDSM